MKKSVILCLLLFTFSFSGYSQSKKLLRTYGITKKTETVVKYKDGEPRDPRISEVEMYDKRGEWIERIDYEKDGGIKKREVRKYHKGLLVEEMKDKPTAEKDSESTSSYSHKVYVFSRQGDLMEEKEMSRKGEVKQRREYTYNKYGDVVTRTTFVKGEVESVEHYSYDKKGFKQERRTVSPEGELLELKMYTYE